jgi:hypothetical protein
MFGFAILSVLFNLLAGLILIFGLIFTVNTIIYRSFKFPKHQWSCFSALWGSVMVTEILGICWNLVNGADAKGSWYDIFIQLPILGCLLGGYIGWRLGKMWDNIPQKFWGLAVGVSLAIAAILFWEYLYSSSISYGDS